VWVVRRSRLLLGVLGLLIAVLAAGCGGGGSTASSSGGGPPPSSDFVPVGAPAYVYVNSDTGGSQWQKLDALSKKFPDRQKLLQQIQSSLTKQGVDWKTDVEPALGPEVGIGVLNLSSASQAAAAATQAVGVTQPKDDAKFAALVKKLDASDPSSPATIVQKIGDWTAISDKQSSIDQANAAHDGTSLADSSTFQSAMSELPDDALAKVYVNGQALTKALKSSGAGSSLSTIGTPDWVAAAVEAKDDGVALSAITKGGQQTQLSSYKASLLDDIPSGALLCVSFFNIESSIKKLGTNPSVQAYLGQLESALGVSLEQVAALFRDEGAIYVRAGTPLPEVTIVLKQSNPIGALATVDKLARSASQGNVSTTVVDGVPTRRVQVSQFSLYYAAFDGKLVITDSPTGISGLKDGGQKLSDDQVFKDAQSAAGMPDETKGFVYVNVKDTAPLVEGLSSLGGGGIPPDVSANLEHVHSFLAYATGSGDENRVDAFLEIR
jgi:hypothetical protein